MLTNKSIELLIDLVEIKIGAMETFDTHDLKAMRELETCRKQLVSMLRRPAAMAAPLLAAASA